MKKVVLILLITILLGCVYLLINTVNQHGMGNIPSSRKLSQLYCQDKKTGIKLTYMEALEIAQRSECNKQPDTLVAFTENYFCNVNTGTFRVDLGMFPEKTGCNPACVVKLSDKTAEINWRCTGAIPLK